MNPNPWDFNFWPDPVTGKEHLDFGDLDRTGKGQLHAVTNPRWLADILVELRCYHCKKYIKPDAAPFALGLALIVRAQRNLEGEQIADKENIGSATAELLNTSDVGVMARIARSLAFAIDERDFKRRRAAG